MRASLLVPMWSFAVTLVYLYLCKTQAGRDSPCVSHMPSLGGWAGPLGVFVHSLFAGLSLYCTLRSQLMGRLTPEAELSGKTAGLLIWAESWVSKGTCTCNELVIWNASRHWAYVREWLSSLSKWLCVWLDNSQHLIWILSGVFTVPPFSLYIICSSCIQTLCKLRIACAMGL